MTSETNLKNEIMIWCGQQGWICIHANVFKGIIWDEEQRQERFVRSGFPNGWPDLIIITNYGITMYCETKCKPNKPTKEQLKIIKILREMGHNAFVAYSLEEFIENVKK